MKEKTTQMSKNNNPKYKIVKKVDSEGKEFYAPYVRCRFLFWHYYDNPSGMMYKYKHDAEKILDSEYTKKINDLTKGIEEYSYNPKDLTNS